MEVDNDPNDTVKPEAAAPAAPAPTLSLKGVVGLANLGNTCYANSTLQAIRYTPDLATLFLDNSSWKPHLCEKNVPASQLVAAFADLAQCLYSSTGPGFIRPRGFWTPMETAARASGFTQFCERSPQDSHEFMMFILDMLHEGMRREVQPIPIPVPLKPLEEKAVRAWSDAFHKSYSPIVDLFFGLALLTTTCKGCGKESHRFDTFNSLKGAIEGRESHTLLESLKNDMRPEEIEGFDCPTCSPVRHNATLVRRFWKLPQYIAFSIKRFHGVGDKKNNPIEAVAGPMSFTELFSADSTHESKEWKYEPYAIVDHHGSYFGGHYTSQAYSPIHGRWNLYDDEHCHELAGGPIFGSSTYMVFLKRGVAGAT